MVPTFQTSYPVNLPFMKAQQLYWSHDLVWNLMIMVPTFQTSYPVKLPFMKAQQLYVSISLS
jgi:hypothetical protein